ncbi:MAG: efflux transporter outer membrane subunit [Verrucomicrobiales bacterium]|nr:efflux transporter outer membrane subunit [Verrucomicrobiales bacterium]
MKLTPPFVPRNSRRPTAPGVLAIVATLALVAAGCAVGPNYQPRQQTVPEGFESGSTESNAAASPLMVELQWWRHFGDPLLDELQAKAATNNFDLKRGQARLQEARALWKETRFDLLPTVRAGASYENTQSSVAASTPGADRDERHHELYRVGFDATWELDLFGRVRRNVEAGRATMASVEADQDDLRVSIHAEVAANYILLRSFQSQIAAAERQISNQSATLQLAETLRDGGRGTQLDVARARSQLESTRATLPALKSASDGAIHRLGVLCGQPPRQEWSRWHSPSPIPRLASPIQPGNPAELLRRRPDLRAAERQVAATTARIGVAVADLFPRVTFQGRLGLEASQLSQFDEGGTDAWGFGPRISWAAFDLGRVRQQVKAARARAEASINIYEQSVLLALEETENALSRYRHSQERLEHLRNAEAAASEAVQLATQRYRDGVADFLTVLDSERVLLLLQLQLAGGEADVATATVAVYKALGGGWTDPSPD